MKRKSRGAAFAAPLQTQQDKEAYSMGASVGNYLSDQIYKQTELGAPVNMDLVVQGFEEALRGKGQLSDDDVLKFLNSRAEQLNKLYDAQKKKLAAANAVKAKEFLDKNAKKKGVKVTKSGLQYEVLKEGKGPKPRTEDVVTVNYEGKLMDGTVFESTFAAKQPERFVLMTVIPGLDEGISMMTEGSRYRLSLIHISEPTRPWDRAIASRSRRSLPTVPTAPDRFRPRPHWCLKSSW